MQLAEVTIHNRLLLGTALYPSLTVMEQAITAAKSEVITVALRRQSPQKKGGQQFWERIKGLGCHVLPNTAGCRTAKEAIMTAHMARELFATSWIKLEVIGDEYTLQPDPFGLLEATKQLVKDGFHVFPYCTDDLVLCQALVDNGCEILMPWGSPIGSGLGLLNPYALKTLRQRFPQTVLVLDAGIGMPSQAAHAMELGFDAVLLNSAVALADDPIHMARAFSAAVTAGHLAYQAGMMPQRDFATPSTSLDDTLFWAREAR